MRLRGTRRSQNVEDRRRMGGKTGAGIGGVGLLVVLAIGYFAGIDVTPLLDGRLNGGGQQTAPRDVTPEEEQAAVFSSKVLATTEQVWSEVFPVAFGSEYTAPVLVLYSGVTQSP